MNQQEPVGLHSRIVDLIVRRIPIEKTNRSLLFSVIVFTHYLADYLILWAILSSRLQTHEPVAQAALPFLILRLVTALLFIILKQPILFLLNKVAIIAQIHVLGTPSVVQHIGVALCQWCMCMVWVMTKQQRQLHFDSCLGLWGIGMKQLVIYWLLLLERVFKWAYGGLSEDFLLLIGLLAVLRTDVFQFYYNTKFKSLLIRLDWTLLVLYALLWINDVLNLNYFEFLLFSLALLLVSFIQLASSTRQDEMLLNLPFWSLTWHDEMLVALYFVQCKLTASEGKHEKITSLAQKILAEWKDQKITKLLDHARIKGKEAYRLKKDVVHTFVIEQLRYRAMKSVFLRNLLLFLYSPDPRVLQALDLSLWDHRREYYRILGEGSSRAMIESFEEEKQKHKAKQTLIKCLQLRQQFYKSLMRQKIQQDKVLLLGSQLIETIQTFVEDQGSKVKQSHQAMLLLQQFSQHCLASYYSHKLPIAQPQPTQIQNDPAVLIAITDYNYSKIHHANMQFRKLGRHASIGSELIKVQSIFGTKLGCYIMSFADRESLRREGPRQQSQSLGLGWAFDSIGYLTLCDISIQRSHYDWQQCLLVKIKPLYCDKALIVISSQGNIIGVSDLARYYDLYPGSKAADTYRPILDALMADKQYRVGRGISILTGNNLVAVDPYSLSILQQFTPPYSQETIYVLEIKDIAPQPPESSKSKIHQPPQFEFTFLWSGRITTLAIDNAIPQWQERNERKQVVTYEQNITQMRYFNGKIDYKANFDEERDCPSLPSQLEERLEEIYEEQMLEKIERKREKVPLKLKAMYVIILIQILLTSSVFTYFLLQFKSISETNSLRLNILTKHCQKQEATFQLGSLTILDKFNLGLNSTAMINAQITKTNTLSSQLYIMDPATMSTPEGETLQSNLNSLNLIINAYLLNSTAAVAVQALTSLARITIGYDRFILATVKSWNLSTSGLDGHLTAILLGYTILASLLFLILGVVEYHAKKGQAQILDILKSIHNSKLELYFQQTANFSLACLQNEQPGAQPITDNNMPQAFNPAKRVEPSRLFSLGHLLLLLWLGNSAVALTGYKHHLGEVNNTAAQYYQFTTNLSRQLAILHATWTGMNINTSVFGSIYMIGLAYRIQYNKSLSFRELAENSRLNISQFYTSFWDGPEFCDYIRESRCSSIIGKGTQKGANLVVSTLVQGLHDAISYRLMGQDIVSTPNINVTVLLVEFYLHQIIQQSNIAILSDYSNFVSVKWRAVWIMQAYGLLFSILLAALFCFFRTRFRQYQRYQDMLLTIPFQELASKPAFHRYYQAHWKNN